MRPVRTLLALLATAVLAVLIGGCGPANASASAAVSSPVAPVVWGAVGDSITFGWGTTTQTFANGVVTNPNAYPAVAGVPAVGMPAQCLVATGCGFGGSWDSVPLVSTFAGELDQLRSQFGVNAVVVEIGVNDLGQGVSDQAYVKAYQQLQQTGAAKGVRVVLSTITPGGPGHYTAAQEAQRERVNAWIRDQGQHVEYAGALGGNVLQAAYDSGDGLHPSDAGAARMAQQLEAWIGSHPKLRVHAPVCVRAPCGPR